MYTFDRFGPCELSVCFIRPFRFKHVWPQTLEARSLAMHRAIAGKLRAHPELLAIANDNLKRRMEEPGCSQAYFEEWQRIPALSLNEVLGLVVEDSERMRALRQCTPFAGVLTPRERWDIYDAFATGAHHPGGGDSQ